MTRVYSVSGSEILDSDPGRHEDSGKSGWRRRIEKTLATIALLSAVGASYGIGNTTRGQADDLKYAKDRAAVVKLLEEGQATARAQAVQAAEAAQGQEAQMAIRLAQRLERELDPANPGKKRSPVSVFDGDVQVFDSNNNLLLTIVEPIIASTNGLLDTHSWVITQQSQAGRVHFTPVWLGSFGQTTVIAPNDPSNPYQGIFLAEAYHRTDKVSGAYEAVQVDVQGQMPHGAVVRPGEVVLDPAALPALLSDLMYEMLYN